RRATPVGGIMFRDDRGNERGGIGYGSASQAMVFAADHPAGEAVGFNVLRDGSTSLVLLARPADIREESLGNARLPGPQVAGIRLSLDRNGVPSISVNDTNDRP